jgi:hypothetical protein
MRQEKREGRLKGATSSMINVEKDRSKNKDRPSSLRQVSPVHQ